jgi:hypothetical protein
VGLFVNGDKVYCEPRRCVAAAAGVHCAAGHCFVQCGKHTQFSIDLHLRLSEPAAFPLRPPFSAESHSLLSTAQNKPYAVQVTVPRLSQNGFYTLQVRLRLRLSLIAGPSPAGVMDRADTRCQRPSYRRQ